LIKAIIDGGIMIRYRPLLLAVILWLMALPALADDITDQLKSALQLYEEGDVTEAIEELEFTLTQMRQKKAEGLGELFPAPPQGWEAEEVESQAMGRAAFGGAVTASRKYNQQKGDGRAEIEVVSDSPMVQSMGMLLNNPAIAGSGKNTKLIRINRQKALLQQDAKDEAELTFLVEGKVLVKVRVDQVGDPAKTVKDFAKLIDIKKLKELTM
jgi:hypothetical protein